MSCGAPVPAATRRADGGGAETISIRRQRLEPSAAVPPREPRSREQSLRPDAFAVDGVVRSHGTRMIALLAERSRGAGGGGPLVRRRRALARTAAAVR